MIQNIVAAAIQGILFFVVALLATSLLRRDSARLRSRIWILAVFSQVALVLLLSIRLPMHLTIPIKRQAVPRSAGERLTFAISSSHILPTVAEPQIDRYDEVSTSAPIAWQIASWGWALGTVICLLRLGFRLRRLHQLSRDSKLLNTKPWLDLVRRLAKRVHIERPVRLSARSAAKVPSTWGVVYPVIELPETADKWSKEQREFILLHELIHIVRWDALMDIAVGIITSIFWFDLVCPIFCTSEID